MTLDTLRAEPLPVLESLFAAGAVPSWADLHGCMTGAWLAMAEDAPVWLWVARQLVFFGWGGHDFRLGWGPGQHSGAGITWFRRGPHRRYPFVTYESTSRRDGQPVLKLDYRSYATLMARLGLVADVRRIEPGLVVGEMWWELPAWSVPPHRLRRKRVRWFVGFFGLARELG